MYTIGQVSTIFDLPISTLRYYDKEGFFPNLDRKSNIRYFNDDDLESIRIIDCLKKSGLSIKDIKHFFTLVSRGKSTYKERRDLFAMYKESVEKQILELNKTLALLKFKCWYYEKALLDGCENEIKTMLPDKLPKEIQDLYDFSHT